MTWRELRDTERPRDDGSVASGLGFLVGTASWGLAFAICNLSDLVAWLLDREGVPVPRRQR